MFSASKVNRKGVLFFIEETDFDLRSEQLMTSNDSIGLVRINDIER